MTFPRTGTSFNLVFILLASAVLTGCAVAIPVQEATPPETLGAGGVRIQVAGGLSPMIGFDEGSIATGTTLGESTTNVGFGLDIGITEGMDLEAYYGIAAVSSDAKIGLKFQWMGQSYFKEPGGTWASSLAARYIYSNAASFNSGGYTTPTSVLQNVTGQGYEISNPIGYRFATWSGFYVGPKIANVNLTGQLDQNGTGNFVQASRNVSGYGGFIGLYLSPHSEHVGLEVTVEFEDMNFPASYGSQRTWYPSFFTSVAIPFHF